MDLENYNELIDLVSKKIAEKFLNDEVDLTERALLLDADMERIVTKKGLEAMKLVYQEALDRSVKKKKK